MKKLGILLIAAGLVLISFISYNYIMNDYKKNQLIKKIDKGVTAPQSTVIGGDKNDDTDTKPKIIPIGILNIPKLNLEVPVIEGTADIRYAVGHITGTGEVGKQDQNYCIAGHRNYLVGDFFRHLDKIGSGDTFTLRIDKNVYKYRVFKTEIVTPDRSDVMNPIKGKSVVTLITCHPEYSSKYRLIVYGELIQKG